MMVPSISRGVDQQRGGGQTIVIVIEPAGMLLALGEVMREIA